VRDADPTSSVTGPGRPLGSDTDIPLLVIDLDASPTMPNEANALRPKLVIGHSASTSSPYVDHVDIALTTSDEAGRPWVHVDDLGAALADLSSSVARHPTASIVATQVMRTNEGVDATRALVIESTAYGMLQGGSEHVEWLANERRHARDDADLEPDVVVERSDDALTLTFNRPRRRNAYRARTRDELVAALELALLDDTITNVHLLGAGSCFGSGGDLSEFGTVHDGATGHLIRSDRNAAHLLSRLGERTIAYVHGPCYGAGVELSAACSTVIAAPDTTMTLPEVSMGLIPGAGGTWSVPRRIGRHRATWLAVTGTSIDAERARQWGLVDDIRAETTFHS